MDANEQSEEKNKVGRPRSTGYGRSRAIADKLAAEENTPLEVMVRVMKQFLDESTAIDPMKIFGDSDDAKKERKALEKQKRDLLREACSIAKDAAPFIHARLQSVAVHGDDSKDPVRTENVNTVMSAQEFATHILARNLPMPDIEA